MVMSIVKPTFSLLLIYLTTSLPALETSCNGSETTGTCQVSNLLQQENQARRFSHLNQALSKKSSPQQPTSQSSHLTTYISPKLQSIEIEYQGKTFLIEREGKSCPPFCIQPMQIKKVKTVGELETLTFIQAMKKHKKFLLIDARNRKAYKKNTIPKAINLPSSLLTPKNPYRQKILPLLGGRMVQNKWYFKDPPKLLIFDNGIWDPQSSQLIQELINVGYPQNRLLYYRGGIESWKNAGLTLF